MVEYVLPLAPLVLGLLVAALGLLLWRGRGLPLVGEGLAVASAAAISLVASPKAVPLAMVWLMAAVWLLQTASFALGVGAAQLTAASVWVIPIAASCALGVLHSEHNALLAGLPLAIAAVALVGAAAAAAVARGRRPLVAGLVALVVAIAFARPLSHQLAVGMGPALCIQAGALTAVLVRIAGVGLTARHGRDAAVLTTVLLVAGGIAASFRWAAGYGVALWAVGVAIPAPMLDSGMAMRATSTAALAGAAVSLVRLLHEALVGGADVVDPYTMAGWMLGVGIGMLAATRGGALRTAAIAVLVVVATAAAGAFWRDAGIIGVALGGAAATLAALLFAAMATPADAASWPQVNAVAPVALPIVAYLVGRPAMLATAQWTRAQKALAVEVVIGALVVLLLAAWVARLVSARRAAA